jgi:Protein of unknown function (DUF4232)
VSALAVLVGAALLAVPGQGIGLAPVPRCATSQLRLSVLDVQGAVSHRYWEMQVRNVGAASCRLQGYPGVGLLDERGRLISDVVQRQQGYPTPSVTIAHGRSAYFTFSFVTAGPCIPHDFTAYGLEVYPPDDYGRLLLDTHGAIEVCDRSIGGAPLVYPIRVARELS